MPRVEVPVTTLNGQLAGALLTTPPVANGDATNDHQLSGLHDGMFLEIANTTATPTTVTFITPGTAKGRAIADDTGIALGANERRLWGPFDRTVYGPDLQIDIIVATVALRGWQLSANY